MDGDPAVEAELDSFSLTFPLPYRIGFIVVLAVWAWGLNLHILQRLRVDVPALIRYPPRTSPTQPPHHLSTYRLATALSILSAVSICTFWIFTRRDAKLVLAYDWVPITYLTAVAVLFAIPLRSFSHGGRGRFLSTLRRVCVGGLADAKDGKFGDILLADVLTSYAKVLGDLYVTMCMFFTGPGATDHPDRSCGGMVAVPLVMAVPSMIRLRQCLIEYGRVRRGPMKESTGWGGQHLANAAKYASAFPVIVLSALQRNLPSEEPKPALNRAWFVAVLFNSLFSFYWDVAKDWDLSLFSPARERTSPGQPYGLRRRLLFPPSMYYVVIGLDLLLRCTWSLKLSPHLDHLSDFESSIFIMEFLEVFRRWMWIFFRVETEWIRDSSTGLGVDDILLGDFQGKDDEYDD